MTYLERRRTKRYKLTNPVKYWWLDQCGSIQASQGKTLDISSNGVMIIAGKCPPRGARIQATIYVAPREGRTKPLELHGEGIVIRNQLSKGNRSSQRFIGFAAEMHFYTELSNDSDGLAQDASENRDTLTAGPVEESSDRDEMFRRS